MNITTSLGQQLEVAETPNGLSVSRRLLIFLIDGNIWTVLAVPVPLFAQEEPVLFEFWYRDDKLHRDEGPAEIRYRYGKVFPGDTRTFEELERDGAVEGAKWHKNGKEVPRFT